MTPPTSKMHTILSHGLRPDVEKSEAERKVIEQQIGQYVANWAYVDYWLGMSIASWANPTAPGNIRLAIETMNTRSKIEFLKALIPAAWTAGGALIRYLTEGNIYRNQLAHSHLAVRGWNGSKELGWHLWKSMSKPHRLELDVPELRTNELKVSVIWQALLAMGSSEYAGKSADELNRQPVLPFILDAPGVWDNDDDRADFVATAKRMFPESA
jgi:hypothetical protein